MYRTVPYIIGQYQYRTKTGTGTYPTVGIKCTLDSEAKTVFRIRISIHLAAWIRIQHAKIKPLVKNIFKPAKMNVTFGAAKSNFPFNFRGKSKLIITLNLKTS